MKRIFLALYPMFLYNKNSRLIKIYQPKIEKERFPMKKILSLILCLTMLVMSTAAFAAAGTYTGVADAKIGGPLLWK